MKFNMFVFLFLWIHFSNCFYSVVDELSFNLKNYLDSKKIYNNFKRKGDSIIYKNELLLAPKLMNSFGFIYSKYVINNKNIEIHFNAKFNREDDKGSAFAIWLFKDDTSFIENEERDISYLGFKNDFNGLGIYFITPPNKLGKHETSIYIKRNYGNKNKVFGKKNIDYSNSCHQNLGNSVSFRIKFSEFGIKLTLKNKFSVDDICIIGLNKGIEAPFRIGISTFNGKINDNEYMDLIKIQKLSVIKADPVKPPHFISISNIDEKNIIYEKNLIEYKSRKLIDSVIVPDKKILENLENYLKFIDKFSLKYEFIKTLNHTYTIQTFINIENSSELIHNIRKIDNFNEYQESFINIIGFIEKLEFSLDIVIDNYEIIKNDISQFRDLLKIQKDLISKYILLLVDEYLNSLYIKYQNNYKFFILKCFVILFLSLSTIFIIWRRFRKNKLKEA